MNIPKEIIYVISIMKNSIPTAINAKKIYVQNVKLIIRMKMI